ncbi:glycosyltransferase family 2 protein [Chitinimonas arctica]|uniref:Glycosyltransferase family 2 protein n=1 Tax=Chitinimonas arctica TaxID=2594795 RepID=A0A516SET6_9NEIS|nr:glycosyltransferase family 2 protein [Chitinimonas arctica]QDQ26675.1 glycosyltransferase family 2 protein [Chitinimonas arctica]
MTPRPAAIGLVIVNYNTSQQVIDCLRSVRNEALAHIVVVDNASPKDDPDAIAAAFPQVTLIKHPQNVGFGEGCNIGVRWILANSQADFVLFLNPDTVIEANLVDRLLAPFAEPAIGITTPRITTMNEPHSLWYGGGYMSWFKGSARVPGYGQAADAPAALLERDVQFATGCAFMMRRSVLEQCGGFDHRFFMYEEDVELSLRVLAAGYRIRYVPAAVVRHIAQGSQGKEVQSLDMFSGKNPKLAFFVYYAARNRFITVFTHGNTRQRALFLLGFAAWFARAGLGWIKYQRTDAFKALFKGLKDFATMP